MLAYAFTILTVAGITEVYRDLNEEHLLDYKWHEGRK